ncbi:MAG: radical SAM protein [Vicinamibacteria bacterium]
MAAHAIPEVGFDDLDARLKVRERRVPIEGTLETTYRCNLRCAHCYVNEAVGDAEEAARELSLERLKQLVDEIADRGCLFLLITGGEVLVRPDFPELYLHALRRGLLLNVYTNGTLITDRIADLFSEWRPQILEISLYGATRETYERVTQVPGSYDKCIAGIRRLVERGVPLRLKTMALSWNYHELEAMRALAASFGLVFRWDSSLNPRVDCGANRNGELQLHADESARLERENPERIAELRAFIERFKTIDAEINASPDGEYVYGCGAGQMSFAVDPYGRLQMCLLSRKRFVDLKQASFAEGWDVQFPEFRARRWQKASACRDCNLRSFCSNCPGAAEMETGDIEGQIPVFCENTHARAFAIMGGDFPGHREDASCCLGRPDGAERGAARVAELRAGGCGSCGHNGQAASEGLIQLQRRAPVAR